MSVTVSGYRVVKCEICMAASEKRIEILDSFCAKQSGRQTLGAGDVIAVFCVDSPGQWQLLEWLREVAHVIQRPTKSVNSMIDQGHHNECM